MENKNKIQQALEEYRKTKIAYVDKKEKLDFLKLNEKKVESKKTKK